MAVLEEKAEGWKETKNAVNGKNLVLSRVALPKHNPPQLSPPMSLVQMESSHKK